MNRPMTRPYCMVVLSPNKTSDVPRMADRRALNARRTTQFFEHINNVYRSIPQLAHSMPMNVVSLLLPQPYHSPIPPHPSLLVVHMETSSFHLLAMRDGGGRVHAV